MTYPPASGSLYGDPIYPTAPPQPAPRPMPFDSPGLRLRLAGTFAQLGLAAALIMEIVLAKAIWDRLELVKRAVANPQTVSLAEVRAADGQVHDVAIAYFVTYLIVGIVFITWFYRARVSAERHNDSMLRFGRGWSIGSWITPLLAMWRPYQMATDVLCASDLPTSARAGARRSYVLLRLWWGFFLASVISVRLYSLGDGATISAFETHAKLELLSGLISGVAAVFAILVVGRITGANDRCREAILAGARPRSEPGAVAQLRAPD